MLFVPGPVDEKGLPFDFREIDKAPKTGIKTVVSVIPHHEIGIFRHRHRPEIVTSGDDALRDGVVAPIDIGLLLLHLVDIQGLFSDFYRIARNANDSLNEVFGFVLWKTKNHHIPPLRTGDRDQDNVGKREFDAVDKLIDEDMVSDAQGRNHRAGRNLKGLNHEGTDKQGQNNRDNEGFCVLS